MTILEWLGAIVGLLVAVGICALGVCSLIDCGRRALETWRYREEEVFFRRAAERIARESFWFSESPEAMEALRCAGESMRDSGWEWRPEQAREEWRRRTKQVTSPG